MKSGGKIAIVLFQLGGPDSLEAVEPFLYNLFLDPDIIDFPFAKLAREPLARYIASRRSKKVSEKYRAIGGKSPILELTQQQAEALEVELRRSFDAKVFIAMRYWHPLTESVARHLAQAQFERIVLLPLYPQYSRTTTGSSLKEWNRWSSALGLNAIRQEIIYSFCEHPLYIEALLDSMNQTLEKFRRAGIGEVTLLFSAHGVPADVIRSGDPYKDHVEKTVDLILKGGRWNLPHVICYQSKVGSSKWLRPPLEDTIVMLSERDAKNLLVIPISFVTDHIETLHEIDVEAREVAERAGIARFEMMPGLNTHPKFILALADLVQMQLEKN